MENYNVFVYGTLKYGQANHSLIALENNSSSTFVGAAVTCAETYVIACNGGFPMIQDTRVMGDNKYKIIGEIYNVNEKTIEKLDMLEGNGRMYSRTKRPFVVNIDGEPTEVVAWIYLFLGDMNRYGLEHADTLKRYAGPNKSKLIEWSR